MTTNLIHRTPPQNPANRRAWVAYRLKLRGQSLASVGAVLGVCRQAVSGALTPPSKRIEPALAKALDLPLVTLFPERFDRKGFSIPRTRPDNLTRRRGIGDSQKPSPVPRKTARAAPPEQSQ